MTELGETQRQFGQRVGLSQGRITQLVKEGLPLLATGRIDVERALAWLEANLDPARRARAKGTAAEAEPNQPTPSTPAAKAKPAPAVPPRPQSPPVSAPVIPPAAPTVSTAGSGVTMAEARRQHEILRVANARLRYEKERGRLVSKDEVKSFLFSRARKERNHYLSWIMRAAPLMASELAVDPSLMFTVLDRNVRECLTELSKMPLGGFPE
jgi:hypothetical protein